MTKITVDHLARSAFVYVRRIVVAVVFAAGLGRGEGTHRLAADIARDFQAGQRIDDPLLDRLDADVVDQRTTQR